MKLVVFCIENYGKTKKLRGVKLKTTKKNSSSEQIFRAMMPRKEDTLIAVFSLRERDRSSFASWCADGDDDNRVDDVIFAGNDDPNRAPAEKMKA